MVAAYFLLVAGWGSCWQSWAVSHSIVTSPAQSIRVHPPLDSFIPCVVHEDWTIWWWLSVMLIPFHPHTPLSLHLGLRICLLPTSWIHTMAPKQSKDPKPAIKQINWMANNSALIWSLINKLKKKENFKTLYGTKKGEVNTYTVLALMTELSIHRNGTLQVTPRSKCTNALERPSSQISTRLTRRPLPHGWRERLRSLSNHDLYPCFEADTSIL